jgi:ClpP class serine protease
MPWLLDKATFDAMKTGFEGPNQPSLSERVEYESRFSDDDGAPASRILTSAGKTSQIKVGGVLTKNPNFMAFLFGGGNTTYTEIAAALAQADADPDTTEISMLIDSGGGQFDGLFTAINAMQATTKKINVVSTGLTASAAYALAAQGDTITAANKASRIGSVGVVATFQVRDDEVQITSTNAPNKRPDVKTPEGVAAVKEELDAMHDLFVDAIATGRGVTDEKVNADFGRGGTLLADQALERGMIDAISGTESTTPKRSADVGGGNQKVNTMKPSELLAQHPDTYAAVMQLGVDKEQDRVGAHLTMGVASDAMDTAIAACKDGSEMTATLSAEYMAAGMAKKQTEVRGGDTVDTGTPAAEQTEASLEAEQVLAVITGEAE